jgi:hypothetical protein
MAVWQCVHLQLHWESFADRIRWFKSIPPQTRMIIGVGVMAYAGAGLYLSDKAEEKFGLTPTEKDREQLRDALPKIAAVEKRNP